MTFTLICPHDRHPLSEVQTGLSCGVCGRQYPIHDGVVRTLDRPDDFYEGAYENKTLFLPQSERFWHVWPLWLINSGYVWAVRRFVTAGATLVELGCAGGVRYFGQRYHAIGCDLSFSSLKKAEFYECKVQADAAICIPFPDNSVDAVVSSYFWEHMPPDVKPHILAETRRILRPGGKLIFLYDVETENPLIRHYRAKDPSIYERLFIAGDGHFGYQRPTENLKMFKAAGLRVVVHKGMEKTLFQSPSVYIKLAQYPTFGNRLYASASRLGKRPLFAPFTALMRLIDTLICPWLPADWARIDLVVCEKTDFPPITSTVAKRSTSQRGPAFARPEGDIPKDGPSAGITMAKALASALAKIPVRAMKSSHWRCGRARSIIRAQGIREYRQLVTDE